MNIYKLLSSASPPVLNLKDVSTPNSAQTVPFLTQSSEQKDFNRKKFQHNSESKQIDKSKYFKSQNMKTWTPQQKKDFFKAKSQAEKQLRSKYGTQSGVFSGAAQQFGVNWIDIIKSELGEFAKDIASDVWRNLDSVVFATGALLEAQSLTQAVNICLLFLKTIYHDTDFIRGALNYFRELLKDDFFPDSAEFKECFIADDSELTFETQSGVSSLSGLLNDWRGFLKHPLFPKLSKILSGFVTLGLCDASSLKWDVNGVRIFAVSAQQKHIGAVDLLDVVLETMKYFLETGYACFQMGSLRPLLYSDAAMASLDSEYYFIVENLQHVKTGNLQKIANIQAGEFETRMSDLIEKFQKVAATTTLLHEKKIFQDRLTSLLKYRGEFVATQISEGLRECPYGIKIFGTTGVGKSSLAQLLMMVVLKANGFSAESDKLYTLNENEAYLSGFKSNMTGVYMDDVNNTKEQFVQTPSSKWIIEFMNNVRRTAIMPDLDSKGVISLLIKALVVTTNDENMGAYTSSYPVTIARRMHSHITAKVKKRFQVDTIAGKVQNRLDEAKVAKYYTNALGEVDIPLFPDLWDLTVNSVVESENHQFCFVPVLCNGLLLENVDLETVIRYLVADSRRHFARQRDLVTKMSNMDEKINLCSCGIPSDFCQGTCVLTDPEEPTNVVQAGQMPSMVSTAQRHAKGLFTKSKDKIEDLQYSALETYDDLMASPLRTGLYLPDFIYTNQFSKPLAAYFLQRNAGFATYTDIKRLYQLAFFIVLCLPFSIACGWTVVLPHYVAFLIAVYTAILRTKLSIDYIVREHLNARDAVKTTVLVRKEKIKRHFNTFAGVVGGTTTLLMVIKLWQTIRRVSTPVPVTQSRLQPETKEEMDARDQEPNPWLKTHVEPLIGSHRQSTSTHEEVCNLVAKNTVFLYIGEEAPYDCGECFFINSNHLIMPKHVWYKNNLITSSQPKLSMRVFMVRGDRSNTGQEFTTLLSSRSTWFHPTSDIAISFVSNSGSYRDLSRFLPQSMVPAGQCTLIHRNDNGFVQMDSAHIEPKMLVSHNCATFFGGNAKLSFPTYSGLCGAVYLRKDRYNHIAGIHLAGQASTPNALYGTLLLQDYQTAVDFFAKKPGLINTPPMGDIPETQFGIRYFEGKQIHDKCPTRHLEGETHFNMYGSVIGRAKPVPSVRPSYISEAVLQICGVPNTWDNPKNLRSWRPWYESLKHMANPTYGLPYHLMELAVIDFVTPLLKVLIEKPFLRDEIHPLNRMENVCGLDAKRFINKIPPTTSVGFPLTGPKAEYLTALDPADYPTQECPMELHEMFWTELSKYETLWLDGERAYPIFKASLKVEPTSITKDKPARVFQCAPLAFQLGIRKYYLPIIRFLQLHPKLSEMAIGVNAQGPEWQELINHVRKYNSKEVFAGDYSKYDLKKAPCMTMASLDIYIRIASAVPSYSSQDIQIMRGIAADLIYPLVAYNGTLIEFLGLTTSGNNITAAINSTDNALYKRCHFFDLQSRGLVPNRPFRSCISPIDYGDDTWASVTSDARAFNIKSFATFLKQFGIIFTMPDKTSELQEFIPFEDADFLKRKTRYSEELKHWVSTLDEKSIFKSLHCRMDSSEEPADIAAGNMAAAMGEWFFYGKEHYNKRLYEMRVIADTCSLTVPALELSFDDRVNKWQEKYYPSE